MPLPYILYQLHIELNSIFLQNIYDTDNFQHTRICMLIINENS